MQTQPAPGSPHPDMPPQPEQVSPQPKPDIPPLKKRIFLKSWLVKYPWLRYNKEENYTFCHLCTVQKKMTSMNATKLCANFQNSTLVRHQENKEHQASLAVPLLVKDMTLSIKKVTSQQDRAASALLKSTHWMACEGIPLSKHASLMELLHEMNVDDFEVLKKTEISYESTYAATEFLSSLSEVVEEGVREEMLQSPYITALVDESTDITNHNRLVIYVQTVDPENIEPKTHFLSNVECKPVRTLPVPA